MTTNWHTDPTAMLAAAKDIWDRADEGPRPTWDYDEWAEHAGEMRRGDEEYELAVLTDYKEGSR